MSNPLIPDEVSVVSESLASRWNSLHAERSGVLSRARECAALTIPALLPPEGFTEAQELYSPASSFGAHCVSNLASKLLLSLFPPNSPFFRLQMDEAVIQGLERMDQQLAKMGKAPTKGIRALSEEALSKQEKVIMKALVAKAFRPKLFHVLKLLIATGNCVFYVPEKDAARVYGLNNFVVKRGADGRMLELIIKESITYAALPVDVQRELQVKALIAPNEAPGGGTYQGKTPIELYTQVLLTKKDKYKVTQMVGSNTLVKGASGTYTASTLPWLVLRWATVDGESYGRSHVEECIGDFRALENYSVANSRLATACSKIVPLVNPNSMTKVDSLNKAKPGQFVPGRKEDISFVQVEKMQDFTVIQKTLEEVKSDLKRAFLLNSSVSRQAERVTAEEVRTLAGELEDHLGGVYSVLSQEFQFPLICLVYAQLKKTGELPALPDKDVTPVITTGLEALGRGNDLNRLMVFVSTISQIPNGFEWLNVNELITRVGTSQSVDMEGLVKTSEQVTQEQASKAQAASQQGLMAGVQQSIPAAVGAVARNMTPEQAAQAVRQIASAKKQ